MNIIKIISMAIISLMLGIFIGGYIVNNYNHKQHFNAFAQQVYSPDKHYKAAIAIQMNKWPAYPIDEALVIAPANEAFLKKKEQIFFTDMRYPVMFYDDFPINKLKWVSNNLLEVELKCFENKNMGHIKYYYSHNIKIHYIYPKNCNNSNDMNFITIQ